jgi:hypothetical protein
MRSSERVMRVMGLLGFTALAAMIVYGAVVAAVAGSVGQAVLLALTALVVLGTVIHMNTRREMAPGDRERFGPSAAWGGRFFWRVYLNSRPRRRK